MCLCHYVYLCVLSWPSLFTSMCRAGKNVIQHLGIPVAETLSTATLDGQAQAVQPTGPIPQAGIPQAGEDSGKHKAGYSFSVFLS